MPTHVAGRRQNERRVLLPDSIHSKNSDERQQSMQIMEVINPLPRPSKHKSRTLAYLPRPIAPKREMSDRTRPIRFRRLANPHVSMSVLLGNQMLFVSSTLILSTHRQGKQPRANIECSRQNAPESTGQNALVKDKSTSTANKNPMRVD